MNKSPRKKYGFKSPNLINPNFKNQRNVNLRIPTRNRMNNTFRRTPLRNHRNNISPLRNRMNISPFQSYL